ncbi:MAG: VapC toxin family PIN domain ribonuclease, partial [Myxococcales bacterium]|nr:VapC toxin family PIN domain ribonuclease [Myxococcales bacterium]
MFKTLTEFPGSVLRLAAAARKEVLRSLPAPAPIEAAPAAAEAADADAGDAGDA